MSGAEIRPHERFDQYADPADLVAADQEAVGEYLATWLRSLRPEWYAEAACIGTPIDVFFPGKGKGNKEALELCGRCAVQQECLDEALADETLDHGIRGGATVAARKLMRRNQRTRPT
jgi:WhiB family redox-sensing transcriptional regulator